MAQPATRQCTLICLTYGEIRQPSEAAITIAKLLASNCQLLLVNPVEDSIEGNTRPSQAGRSSVDMHLLARGKSIGIKATLQRLSLDASLKHMAALTQNDFLIIAQPEHPLERQTLSFTSLSTAAEQARALTLYVPPVPHSHKTEIAYIGPDDGSVMAKLAHSIAVAPNLHLRFINPTHSANDIMHKILQAPYSARPALLIISTDWLAAQSISPSRLAASCQTPVFVY